MTRLALILLLVGGALGIFFAVKGGGEQLPPSIDPDAPVETDEAVDPMIQTGGVSRREADREEVPRLAPSGAEAGQGVQGIIVDPGNRPVAGAKVYLMEGSTTDIMQAVRAFQQGVVFPPAATDVTGSDGRFALGLRQLVPDAKFELRIVTEEFADHKVPNLVIQKDDWFDAGAIQLDRGATVYGHVTVAGEGLVVPNATIYIKAVQSTMEIAPTPGREQGLKVVADESGYFEVHNAPAGTADISAAAPYFARIQQQKVSLDPRRANEVNFQLSRGLAIRGVVTDPDGVPVRGAKVMANSLLPKQPQTEETRTGSDGTFEFLSLVDAPFQLTAVAQGFQRRDEKPVQAGSEDVELILDKQGAAHVKVVGRNRVLRNYTLIVNSHFARQDMIGHVQNQMPRQIRAGDLKDGFATVEGLDPGSYVFQVIHPEYAKTFSDPFTIGSGVTPPVVEMRMSAGGGIVGTVTDHRGAPVRGVRVQTQQNGYVRNALTDSLGGLVPKKITETAVRTDAQGRFRMGGLARGIYQLEFTHPEFSETRVKDLNVTEGQNTQAPQLRLVPGTVLLGMTRLDGVPSGQIKVLISQVRNPNDASPASFNAEAVSNNEGDFLLPKRVPPGTYQVQAARTAAGPFEMMLEFEKTRRTVSVGLGQPELRMVIDLTSR